ncbi:FGGY family carbohydrate kinase [Pseudokineococcus sp. 5B2Z-1]|uniref:FGGY family carbohydrate kinase n=1 Tax=Pseudokineococcus sp. 5B2Z-1 TaxID=3132744 RepID=UPI00309E6A3D
MTRLVAGLDLGSTGLKVLVVDADTTAPSGPGRELLVRQRPTPWRAGPGGTTDLSAEDLLAALADLLAEVADLLPDLPGVEPGSRVEALAVSGMGETGFLLDAEDRVVAPGCAWFDPRGAEQVAALPEDLRRGFAGRTGLPWGVQVSVAKVLHLRDGGLDLTGLQWLSVPELVVAAAGGRRAAELSLASRTGLLDQDTGLAWPEMLAHVGVDETFLPPLVPAGTPLGTADADWLPASFAGASLTVAGHDHLVSAVSGGAIPGDRYHVSTGTAEVLLRVVDEPPSAAARERLGQALVNCVRHVVPGQHVLVAGVKTGLLMRRVLQMAGISDRAGRDRLDEAVLALGGRSALPEGGVEVHGARNDDGVLRLVVRTDGLSPAELFAAVLEHGNDEVALLVEAMDREVPPAASSLLTGGWAGMRSVAEARARVLPDVTVSARAEDTAHGAALFAARLLPDARLAPATAG